MTLSGFTRLCLLLLLPPRLVFASNGRTVQQPLVIAHMGRSGEMPPQTLETLKRGYEDGADALEFDLVVTKDRQLVVLNSVDLGAATDIDDRPRLGFQKRQFVLTTTAKTLGWQRKSFNGYPITEFTGDEVRQVRKVQSKAWRSRRLDGLLGVAFFEDVLREFQNKSVSLIVDLKYPSFMNKMLRSSGLTMEELVLNQLRKFGLHDRKMIVNRRGRLVPKVYLMSFEEDSVMDLLSKSPLPCILAQLYGMPSDAEIYKWYKKKLYGINIWKFPTNASKGMLYSKQIKEFNPDQILSEWPEFLRKAHARSFKVFVFVFAEEEFVPRTLVSARNEVQRFKRFGVDGMLFDFPRKAKVLLKPLSVSASGSNVVSVSKLLHFVLLVYVMELLAG